MQSNKECTCIDTTRSFEVNTRITFHIETIPFSTNRKYRHFQCGMCAGAKGFFNNADANAYHKEVDDANAYLAGQDKRYSSNGESVIPMFGNEESDWMQEYIAPIPHKQWVRGQIRYSYYDEENKFKFGFSDFNIYSTERDWQANALAQFIKSDSFHKIVGLKVWGPHPTRDSRQVS